MGAGSSINIVADLIEGWADDNNNKFAQGVTAGFVEYGSGVLLSNEAKDPVKNLAKEVVNEIVGNKAKETTDIIVPSPDKK